MARMLEYLNPQNHTVQLSSPDKKIIRIPPNTKVVLSDWYINYCPKYLRVVREIGDGAVNPLEPKPIENTIKYRKESKKPREEPRPGRKKLPHANKTDKPPRPRPTRDGPRSSGTRAQVVSKQVVGRPVKGDGNKLFIESCQKNDWTISNNVGVGILSFNRLASLQRLVSSIRSHTDLRRVTVFVSDESTNDDVKKWLKEQTDIVVLTDQKRLGIAGNSNRLLHCLSRFKYCFLLNDDVEIINQGWIDYYANAALATGFKHFCYHQTGVYGARRSQRVVTINNYQIETIEEKPHGAIMFYTNEVFEKVGYFDERFGFYGMEHVDWSERVGFAGLQPPGFHDILGSEKFFKIHQEKSEVVDRGQQLAHSRQLYSEVRNPSRIYVEASKETAVPSISVVIPLRNLGRQESAETIIQSVRAQLFPNIDIILAEQDEVRRFNIDHVKPIRLLFAKSKYVGQPFTKAMAFNLGVASARYHKVVLQDADIACPSRYLAKIDQLLNEYEGVHIGSRVLYLTQESSAGVERHGVITENSDCERAVGYFEGGSLACTKTAYVKIGGFNEMFEGYGVEDCDFFERLKNFTRFFNTRTEDFVHLWHGRTSGWELHHRRNKKIIDQINKSYTKQSYVNSLVAKIRSDYPQAIRELGL